MTQLIRAFNNGGHTKALAIHNKLDALNKALFADTNPIPIKTAMNLMGFDMGGPRLPPSEMTQEHREELKTLC